MMKHYKLQLLIIILDYYKISLNILKLTMNLTNKYLILLFNMLIRTQLNGY